MIPSCFSNPNPITANNSSQTHQNLTTCTYQAHLFNSLTSPGYVTLTWSKSQSSHSLTIYVPDKLTIAISLLQPALSSIFKSRSGSGSKSIINNDLKIKVIWDFCKAKFSQSSAAPESGFYIAILTNGKLNFFLGDLKNELSNRVGLVHLQCNSVLVSRRDHVFGHRSYKSNVELLGSKRDILVQCYNGVLKVKVDGKTCLVVKRLAWKFRGNEKIFICGNEVQFYWDVFNWVKTSCGSVDGHGLFMFLVGDGGGSWPEMIGPERKLMMKNKQKNSFSMNTTLVPLASSSSGVLLSPMQSCSSVLQWAEESSEGCRSSCSLSNLSCGSNSGFSLLMYAWRKD